MTNSDSEHIPLREVCEAIFDGPHATPRKTSHGPVFLGISNLNSGRLDLSETEHLSEEDFVTWTRRVTPQPGDIVFSYETRLGEAAMVPEGLTCCLGRRMGLIRPDRSKVDPRFLLFAFLGPEFQQTIRERTIAGSTVERILLTELGNFPIRIPSLTEQRAIASILGALDDKIEVNHEINRTLDALGQTLFRSWFIDFDPVWARQAGRTLPGVSSAIDRLFPDRLVESEWGRVPAGWRIGKLADVCKTQYGYTASAAHLPAGPKLLRVTDINKLPWIEWTDVPHCAITAGMYERYKLHVGDVVVSRMADPGKAGIIEEPVEAVFASYLIRLMIPQSWSYYVYYFLRSKEYLDYADSVAGGTVQKNMNARVITGVPLVIPPSELAEAFHGTVSPLRRRLTASLQESRTLTILRDSLLPGLVSGELRMRSAERLVEQAV